MIHSKKLVDITTEAGNLIVGLFADKAAGQASVIEAALGVKLSDVADSKYGEVTIISTLKKLESPLLYVVGLGKSEEFDLEKFRNVIGKISKKVKNNGTLLLETFGDDLPTLGKLAAEANGLATFQTGILKTEGKKQDSVAFTIAADADLDEAIKKGSILAEATNRARALVNLPGNYLTPTALADEVAKFAKEFDLECRIIDKPEMEEMKMGGLLGVNRGSTEVPKMIVVKYQGTDTFENVTALVGKGLTFDTGGYTLKPRTAMNGMQGDMGGAASAIGAFEAAVRLKLPVNLLLIVPSTDNMVSADAIKPGDVITMMGKKTVEVTNTDAEGRLILADALALANEYGASRIINLATLIGAIIVALGSDITGAFTNDEEFMTQLEAASFETHEQLWQMPLHPRDAKALRNSVSADLNNAPLGKPGAIMAAAFLKE
ncbi:MAG: leucyl aminopeptidase, partial [Turicibacter sp.]|nr:leucyl aminopeptidase [Turicibacter sp.]